jgi:hypothetical protein
VKVSNPITYFYWENRLKFFFVVFLSLN